MGSDFANVYEVSHILKTVIRELSALVFNISHQESETVEVSGKRLFITIRKVSKSSELFKDMVSSHSVGKLVL